MKYHPYYQRFKSFDERFWEKVDVRGDHKCWNWIAGITTTGYGQFSNKKTSNRAHRVAWELCRGKVPRGKMVLHRCDNRRCVNPHHLYIGNDKQNSADKVARNRLPNQNGENNPYAKLSNESVTDIRSYAKQGCSHTVISEFTGIRRQHITKIIQRQIWSHVE